MLGWHHWLNGHEFAQTLGDSEGQRSPACSGPWTHKESDTTEKLNNKEKALFEQEGKPVLGPLSWKTHCQCWLNSLSKRWWIPSHSISSIIYSLILYKCHSIVKNHITTVPIVLAMRKPLLVSSKSVVPLLYTKNFIVFSFIHCSFYIPIICSCVCLCGLLCLNHNSLVSFIP